MRTFFVVLVTETSKLTLVLLPRNVFTMSPVCYTLVRQVPGAEQYLADAGVIYDDENQVVEMIAATAEWTDEQWSDCQARASSRAEAFEAKEVLAPMFSDWQALVKR